MSSCSQINPISIAIIFAVCSPYLERQGGPVVHLSDVESAFQPGDLDRFLWVLECLEGLADECLEVFPGDVLLPNEGGHDPVDQVRVGEAAPLLQLLQGEGGQGGGEVEAAVLGIAREQHLEGQGLLLA